MDRSLSEKEWAEIDIGKTGNIYRMLKIFILLEKTNGTWIHVEHKLYILSSGLKRNIEFNQIYVYK